MDDKLRREIARRVAEHKQGLADVAAMRAHVAALADVFGVEPQQVEAIAARAATERAGPRAVARRALATLSRFQILTGFAVAACILVGGAWLLTTQAGPGRRTAAVADAQVRRASIVASILGEISPIRMMVVEHLMVEGQYPTSLEDLGLKREEMRTAQYVADVVLGPAGEIIVKSDDSPGENVYLVLAPEQKMGGLSTHWRCLVSTEIRELQGCSTADLSEHIAHL